MEGKDFVGQSLTGSGKTLAFLIPAIEMVIRSKLDGDFLLGYLFGRADGACSVSNSRIGNSDDGAVQAVAHLAIVCVVILLRHRDISVKITIGGTDVVREAKSIGRPHIIIATPGRFLDHISVSFVIYSLCEDRTFQR